AIAAAERGHAYGARALFVTERRLARDGVRDYYARVSRTNEHGLYFMLRCGYAPVPPLRDDGATWFRRAAPQALTPHDAVAAPPPVPAGRRVGTRASRAT